MTIQEFINKEKARLQAIQNAEQAHFLAASTASAMQVERIFTSGLAADGTAIGDYDSTKPLYVNPKNAPKNTTPEGKYGDKVFKNGQPHKTTYFGSYKNFRENQGRKTDTVNLDLFGRLKSEYENSMTRNGTAYETVLRSPENIGKAVGNQKKYGKSIFSLSDKEREAYVDTYLKELEAVQL